LITDNNDLYERKIEEMNQQIADNKLHDKTSFFYKLFIEIEFIKIGFIVRNAIFVKKCVIITENRVQYERKIGEMAKQMAGIYKMITNSIEENQLLYLI
jgi:hypothetical protein